MKVAARDPISNIRILSRPAVLRMLQSVDRRQI